MKKFCKCLLKHNYIEKEDYDGLYFTIKINKDICIEKVNRYNNIDLDYFY